MAIQFADPIQISAPVVNKGDLTKLAILQAEESRRERASRQAGPGGTLPKAISEAQGMGQNLQQIQQLPIERQIQEGQAKGQLEQLQIEQAKREVQAQELERQKEFFRDPVGAVNKASAEEVYQLYGRAFGNVPESVEIPSSPRRMTEEEYVLKRAADANQHDFATDEDRRRFVENEKDAARAEYFEDSKTNPEKFTFTPPPKVVGPDDPKFAETLRSQLRDETTRLMQEEADIKNSGKAGVGAARPRKQVLESQDRQIRALAQAKNDIDTIDKDFEVAAETGLGVGPVSGLLRNLNPWDQSNAELKAAINSALPNLARGVFGEVGVLTDRDIARYRELLPTSRSTKGIARALSNLLREKLEAKVTSDLGIMHAEGYDVGSVAQKFGLSEDDLDANNQPLPEGGAAPNEGNGNVVNLQPVQSAEEAKRLPPNVKFFRAPDGRVFKNPNFQGQ